MIDRNTLRRLKVQDAELKIHKSSAKDHDGVLKCNLHELMVENTEVRDLRNVEHAQK